MIKNCVLANFALGQCNFGKLPFCQIGIWPIDITSSSKGALYSKMMFLVLDQVYYLRFQSNTHNNYYYIIKTY
jgi:hypothetical protein